MVAMLWNRGTGFKGLWILFVLALCQTPIQAQMGKDQLFEKLGINPSRVNRQVTQQQAPDQLLRQRVEAYYSLLQAGRYGLAEDYVVADSRAAFRETAKGPFLGFRIESVNLDPDGNAAQVSVMVRSFLPTFASKPVDMPNTTRWQLVSGLWCLVLPKTAPPASPLAYLAGKKSSTPRPSPELLQWKGHHYNLGKMKPGETKVARFPFTNVSNHDVTITRVVLGTPLLKLESYKKQLRPGESGELAVEFDPAGVQQGWANTIVVKSSPGNQLSYLTLIAYVVPPETAPKPGAMGPPTAASQRH